MQKKPIILICIMTVSVGCEAPATEDTTNRINEQYQDPENENVGEAQSSIDTTDIRWAIQHGAASAACAAASPENDSWRAHVVVAKPYNVTCSAACAANTGGIHVNCRTAIAVGMIRTTQASAYTDIVSMNYRYSCSNWNGGDEVLGQGADTASYTSYCCCYQ